jgi:bifunctional DNase/RNase
MTREETWVELRLARIVQALNSDRQFIYLTEVDGERGFPIMIGNWEASEMDRIVNGEETKRPLTHQLLHTTIKALGAALKRVDIVDLRDNTYFAQLVLENRTGDICAVVDARPSDAIALALRASCPLRVTERVLAAAARGPDTEGATEQESESEPESGDAEPEDPESGGASGEASEE